MAGGPGSGKGKAHPCSNCSKTHYRKTELCYSCERGGAGLGLPEGGHWQPGRHGVLRWVS